MNCPYCNSEHVIKGGTLPSGNKRYYCRECKKSFSTNTVLRKPKINDVCPYCGGSLKYRGHNKSGTTRYKCKECGKSCSESTVKEPKIVDYGKECPICHSKQIKKSGKLKDGTQRWECKSCGKSFSDKTKINPLIGTIECPQCSSKEISMCGTENGKQRYQCRSCKKKFKTETVPRNFKYEEIECPKCGNNKAKRAGFSNKKEQYYICTECNHKFLKDGSFKHLTPLQKNYIVEQVLRGKNISKLSEKLNINEKTIRSTVNPFYATEKITNEQKQLIIKYGIYLKVPVDYLAEYVPCSEHKCNIVIKEFKERVHK